MGATHASFQSAGKTPALTEMLKIVASDLEMIGAAILSKLFGIWSKPAD